MLKICVHPEKKEFGFVREDEWTHEFHVHVRSKALENQANLEVERECAKLFGVKVKIVHGLKSPHKVVEVLRAQREILQLLRQHIAELV